MIKLATMTSVCPDWTLDQIIEGMHAHGYEGLEPRIGWNHACGVEPSMTPKERDGARSKVENAGLKFVCVSTGARFATVDPAELKKHLEDTRAAMDLAADLGAPYVRTFGGDRGKGEFHFILQRTADAYRKILDHAEARGVTVLMETHDDWCVSAQVRAVIEAVAHPRLAALWDIMHPQRYKEHPKETMVNLGPHTRHLHAHDARFDEESQKMITVALDAGVLDYVTPLKLLSDAGFDGYLSLEIIHKRGTPHDADATLKQNAEGFRAITSNIA